ncbi:MAG: putative transposase [Polaromonas sp.]|nr:putative transposase [Polaromonas sp.]
MAEPRAVSLTLSEADRVTLRSWTRRRSTSQGLALRARIVLACAEPGTTNLAIAARLGISLPDGGQVAATLCPAGHWRPERCTPPGRAAQHLGRAHRAGNHDHALEHAPSGQGAGHEPDGNLTHLACLCAGAPPQRDVQALN